MTTRKKLTTTYRTIMQIMVVFCVIMLIYSLYRGIALMDVIIYGGGFISFFVALNLKYEERLSKEHLMFQWKLNYLKSKSNEED